MNPINDKTVPTKKRRNSTSNTSTKKITQSSTLQTPPPKNKSIESIEPPSLKELEIDSSNNPLTKRYKIEEIIGNGAASVVHKAVDADTNEMVAVKKIHKVGMKPEQQKIFMNSVKTELQLLQELNHPNIVNIIGSMEDKSFIYIILEYVERGSLSKLLQKYGPFPKEIVSVQIKQVLSGLAYLHKNGIIHRDIKAANILLDDHGVAKLADFGVSAKLKNETEKRYSVVGTPYWMAPEVIQMSGHTEKSDIWSIGCLTLELLTGHPPYWELEQMRAIFCVVKDDVPPIPPNIKGDVRDFLYHCFVKNVDKRSSAEELLNHKWIVESSEKSSGYKKLKKTLKKVQMKEKKKRTKKQKKKKTEEKKKGTIVMVEEEKNNDSNGTMIQITPGEQLMINDDFEEVSENIKEPLLSKENRKSPPEKKRKKKKKEEKKTFCFCF